MARALYREFGPVLGVGRVRLRRHPVWAAPTRDGDGVGVVVVPGFGGSDPSMAVLRRWLRSRGYRPTGARLWLNLGCTGDLVDRLEQRVVEHARATGGPVVLLGHSRGGWLSRLVAVRRPELVRGLVMLGSPVLDPLDARGLAPLLLGVLVRMSALGLPGLLDRECIAGTCRDTTLDGLTAPLSVPAVAIFSRDDGVVGWESCRDPAAEWVEVRSSHTGMGIDPELYEHLVPRLRAWVRQHRIAAA
ncbi:alpha/beta fold hydrolase [Pseudonocardia sp. S2-4]|uniref:Alpha/beta fold hydrolase n=1 Tax=Pseudonocardia humida TaxID=2800819 RepID=A0ABT1AC71_9PSEU|nr:alpha/beta fold hydrolase [Pseudonocardia humida]